MLVAVVVVRGACRRRVDVLELGDLLVEEPIGHAAEDQEPQDTADPRQLELKEPPVLVGPLPPWQADKQFGRAGCDCCQHKACRHQELLHVCRFRTATRNLPRFYIVLPRVRRVLEGDAKEVEGDTEDGETGGEERRQ